MVHSKQVVQKTAEESASLIRFGDSFCITPCGSENCTGGIAECFIELICFGDNFFITPCGSENCTGGIAECFGSVLVTISL